MSVCSITADNPDVPRACTGNELLFHSTSQAAHSDGLHDLLAVRSTITCILWLDM